MRAYLGLVCLALSGCASHDVFLYEARPDSAKPAIIGVSGIDVKLETIDGKVFENFGNKGIVHRVHVEPGTHRFGLMALSEFDFGYQTVSYKRDDAEVSAKVLAGHVYGFRSELTAEGRLFRIVDLGTDVDPSCFRPGLNGLTYVSQTCQWPTE
jgi:hypothetical protein